MRGLLPEILSGIVDAKLEAVACERLAIQLGSRNLEFFEKGSARDGSPFSRSCRSK